MGLQEILAKIEALPPEELQILKEFVVARAAELPPPPLSVGDLIGDLAGGLDGLPPDLSTNPKYMEGFGR